MSSGTMAKPEPLVVPLPAAAEATSEAERFTEERLRQTRRQVRWVDVAAGVLGIAVGGLAYLLPGTWLDHWVVAGGLGPVGRWVLWLILVAAVGVAIVRRVAPPLRFRVNPVFAAYTLERARPAAKNSLINLLLLRGRRREVAPVIYAALEHRAADELRQIEIEAAVERRHVFRLAYALVAVVAVFCAYQVFSPKSAVASALRILLPWANIPAPTRVTIDNVVPGNTVAFHGDSITVTAEVRGLRADEAVTLLYSTADGQIIDQAVPMERPRGDYRYRAVLPPRRAGLQQDHLYRVAAGDCTTPTYRVVVQVAPAIAVESIEYEYPPYTGLGRATVPRQGDLRAIEGTTVLLRAAANHPIRRAEIDLGCDGRHLLSMQCDDRRATGRFVLRLAQRDPPNPEYDAYQLLFTDRSGRSNPRPIRYRIEVIADLAPLVEWVEPQRPEVAMAEDGRLDLVVKARDPDFALRRVTLHFESEQGDAPGPVALLDRPAPAEGRSGELVATFRFEPIALGLQAGQRVACWAEAVDNKLPEPNRALSQRRWIRILSVDEVGPAGRQAPAPSADGQDDPAHTTPDPTAPAGQPLPPDQPGAAGEPSAAPPDRPSDSDPRRPGAAAAAEDDGSGAGASGGSSPRGEPGDPTARHGENDLPGGGEPAARPEQPQSGEPRNEPPQPVNPLTNPGDAFERILEHLRRAEQRPADQLAQRDQSQTPDQQPASPQQSPAPGAQPPQEPRPTPSQPATPQTQPPEAQSPQTQQPSGGQSDNQPAGAQQAADPRSGGQQGGGEPSAGHQTGGRQSGGQQQPGGQPSGSQPSGGQPHGAEQGSPPAGGQPGGAQQGGSQPGAAQPSATEPTAGQSGTGEQSSAAPSAGSPRAGEPTAGQPPSGQPSDNQPPGGQPPAGQPSDNQPPGGQPSDDQSSENRQPGGQPTGAERPAGQEPSSRPGEEPPTAAVQPGGQPPTGLPGSAAPEAGLPDQSPGTQPAEPRGAGEPPQGNPAADASRSSPGERPPAGGQPAEGGRPQQPGTPSEPPDQRSGGGEPNPSQGAGGAGQRSESPEAGSAPQEANRERPKRPGESGASPSSRQPGQPAQSPTTSPHESDSSSDTAGDRSGGGEQGGGQHANQPGIGSPGTQTDAASGGSRSDTPGEGETGARGGDRAASSRPSGGQTARTEGGRSGQGATSSSPAGSPERPSDASQSPGTAIERPTDGGTAGQRVSNGPGARGDAEPTSGGAPADRPVAEGADAGGQSSGSEANLEYARRQTELALEHLKDQIARQQPELLDQLGWTRQQAEQFLREWEEMKRRAARGGPEGEAARRELDDALRSLGLQPRGAQLRGGRTGADRVEGVGQSGRIEPPGDWAEWLRAYTKGVAEGKR